MVPTCRENIGVIALRCGSLHTPPSHSTMTPIGATHRPPPIRSATTSSGERLELAQLMGLIWALTAQSPRGNRGETAGNTPNPPVSRVLTFV